MLRASWNRLTSPFQQHQYRSIYLSVVFLSICKSSSFSSSSILTIPHTDFATFSRQQQRKSQFLDKGRSKQDKTNHQRIHQQQRNQPVNKYQQQQQQQQQHQQYQQEDGDNHHQRNKYQKAEAEHQPAKQVNQRRNNKSAERREFDDEQQQSRREKHRWSADPETRSNQQQFSNTVRRQTPSYSSSSITSPSFQSAKSSSISSSSHSRSNAAAVDADYLASLPRRQRRALQFGSAPLVSPEAYKQQQGEKQREEKRRTAEQENQRIEKRNSHNLWAKVESEAHQKRLKQQQKQKPDTANDDDDDDDARQSQALVPRVSRSSSSSSAVGSSTPRASSRRGIRSSRTWVGSQLKQQHEQENKKIQQQQLKQEQRMIGKKATADDEIMVDDDENDEFNTDDYDIIRDPDDDQDKDDNNTEGLFLNFDKITKKHKQQEKKLEKKQSFSQKSADPVDDDDDLPKATIPSLKGVTRSHFNVAGKAGRHFSKSAVPSLSHQDKAIDDIADDGEVDQVDESSSVKVEQRKHSSQREAELPNTMNRQLNRAAFGVKTVETFLPDSLHKSLQQPHKSHASKDLRATPIKHVELNNAEQELTEAADADGQKGQKSIREDNTDEDDEVDEVESSGVNAATDSLSIPPSNSHRALLFGGHSFAFLKPAILTSPLIELSTATGIPIVQHESKSEFLLATTPNQQKLGIRYARNSINKKQNRRTTVPLSVSWNSRVREVRSNEFTSKPVIKALSYQWKTQEAANTPAFLEQPLLGLTVLDATAGLCGDAFRMAFAGAEVIACERHPALYSLVQYYKEVYKRRKCPGKLQHRLDRMKVFLLDSIQLLQRYAQESATKNAMIEYASSSSNSSSSIIDSIIISHPSIDIVYIDTTSYEDPHFVGLKYLQQQRLLSQLTHPSVNDENEHGITPADAEIRIDEMRPSRRSLLDAAELELISLARIVAKRFVVVRRIRYGQRHHERHLSPSAAATAIDAIKVFRSADCDYVLYKTENSNFSDSINLDPNPLNKEEISQTEGELLVTRHHSLAADLLLDEELQKAETLRDI